MTRRRHINALFVDGPSAGRVMTVDVGLHDIITAEAAITYSKVLWPADPAGFIRPDSYGLAHKDQYRAFGHVLPFDYRAFSYLAQPTEQSWDNAILMVEWLVREGHAQTCEAQHEVLKQDNRYLKQQVEALRRQVAVVGGLAHRIEALEGLTKEE